MLRHCVLLTLTDDAPQGQVDKIVDQLMTLPGLIPEITSYSVGGDAGLADGNATMAVVAEFANETDYQTYAAQADHVAIINEHIKPYLASRAAVQYTLS